MFVQTNPVSLGVSEHAENNTLVGTVSATDAEGDSLIYSLLYNAEGRFSIDPFTGEIKLVDNSDIDHETIDSYSLLVGISDGSTITQQLVEVAITDANDIATVWGEFTGTVVEDAADNTVSGQVFITDPDDGMNAYQAATLNGQYGQLSINSEGEWTYTLDNNHVDLAGLHNGDSREDTIQIATKDGQLEIITITISGNTDNYAPLLDVSVTPLLAFGAAEVPTDGDTSGSLTVASFIDKAGSLSNYKDSDAGEPGIAVFDAAEGVFYSTDQGATWIDFSGVSSVNGILLDKDALIYAANTTEAGNVLGFRAWDSTQGVSGTTGVDISEPQKVGGGTPYSMQVDYIQSAPETLVADNENGPYYTIEHLANGLSDTLAEDAASVYNSLEVADVNSDGIDDLIVNELGLQFWIGQEGQDALGNSTIVYKKEVPALGNKFSSEVVIVGDSDGFNDLITSSGHTIYYYNGLGGTNFEEDYTSQVTLPVSVTHKSLSLMTVDLDGDGRTEIIVSTRYGDQPWFVYNIGETGQFVDISDNYSAIRDIYTQINGSYRGVGDIAVGDFNGDGLLDLYTKGHVGANQVLIQQDNGTYSASNLSAFLVDGDGNAINMDDHKSSVAFMDLDGDGNKNDLLLGQLDASNGYTTGKYSAFLWDDSQNKFVRMDTNTAASIQGTSEADIVEDTEEALTFNGALTVVDVDADESRFVANSFTGTYGLLVIDEAGEWTYTADNSTGQIDALAQGQVVEDLFSIESVDGTTQSIKIRITGVNDAPEVVVEGYTLEAVIPELTSNNDQGIVVTASNQHSSSYQAYMAMDGIQADVLKNSRSWAARTSQEAWLQVDLGDQTNVLEYSLTGINIGSRAPKEWQLLGSDDGQNFVVLDTQSDQTNWSPYETRLYQLSEVASFQYYRIHILKNNGNGYQGLDGFQLFSLSESSALSVDENSQLTLDVLANATDKDQGDTLSLVSADVVDYRGEVVDGRGVVTIVDDKLVYHAASVFESLAQDEEAYVSIRYVMQDSEGAQVESSTLIKVTGVNDAPEFEHRSLSIDEAETIVLSSVHLSVDDIDSEPTDFVYTLSDLSLVVVTGANDLGGGRYAFTQAQLDAGEISITHDGSNDAPSLKVEVSDGIDSSAVETFTVIFAAHNDEPVTSLVDLGSTDEDVKVTITQETLLQNATDAEGDKLEVHHVRLVDDSQGVMTEVSEGVWELTPAENVNGDNVQIEYDIHDYSLISHMDFSNGLEAGWSQLGGLEIKADGGLLGHSPTGTPILEIDHLVDHDGISFTVDTSLGIDHRVTLVLAQRPTTDGESIDIVWDGTVIQTITPESSDWETVVVDLPHVDKDNTDLVIRELSDQNDGVGVRLDSVSIYTEALSTVTGTAEIDITAIDDAPEVAPVDLGVTKEDNPLVFSVSDLLAGVTDVDSGALNVTQVTLADDAQGAINIINTLVFLDDTDNAIQVNGTLPELDQFTIAFDYISTGANSAYDPLFSLATPSSDNSLLIEASRDAGNIKVVMGGQSHLFKGLTLNDGQLQVFALSWNNETGSLKLYNSGVLHEEATLQTGGTIPADGLAFVGQEQDTYGGGFNSNQVMKNAAMHRMTLLSEEMPAEIIGLNQPLSFFSDQVELDIQSADGFLFDGSGKHTLEKAGSIEQVPSYYVYSPAENFSADKVDINFTVTDGVSLVDGVATVKVDAVNDSPVTNLVDLGSVAEGSNKVITAAELLSQTADVEGDELSIGHVRLRDPQYGTIIDNGDDTWTLLPTDNIDVADISIDFDVIEKIPHSLMDFSNHQFAEGWSNIGKEIHGDGEALGSSATSTPLLELDSNSTVHDSLSYTLDMSNDTAYRLVLSMRERSTKLVESDTVEVLLDGQLIATFEPNTDFDAFEVDIEPTGNSQAVVTIQEKADQNNGGGAIIDTVSLQVIQQGTAQIDITPVNDAPVLVTPEYDTLAAYDFRSTEELSGKAQDATFGAGAVHTETGIRFNQAGGELGELQLSGALTIATTFTYHSYHGWARIFDFGNGRYADNILMGTTSNGQIRVHIYQHSNDVKEVYANNAYTLGQPFHATMTVDESGHMKLYIDGELAAENPNGHVPRDILRTSNKIGESNWGEHNTNGDMDDLVIIDRAIDAAEVQTLYEEVSAKDFSRFKLLSSVDEHSANGTVVGSVGAQDEDSETLTFSLEDDAGGRFVIDSATGEISVADGTLLDYETSVSHSVIVKVSDGELDDEQSYQIHLNDVNEAPVIAPELSLAVSAPVQLDAANQTQEQSYGQITQLSDGTYMTVWLEGQNDWWNGDRIKGQKLDASMNPIGPVVTMTETDVEGDDSIRHLTIEALSDGGFVVSYQRFNPGIAPNGTFRVFDNDMTAMTGEVSSGEYHFTTGLVALDDGGFLTLGFYSDNEDNVQLKRWDAEGVWQDTMVSDKVTPWKFSNFSGVSLGDGKVAALWRSNKNEADSIQVLIYDAGTGTGETATVIAEANFGGPASNIHHWAHIKQLMNGDLVVLYSSGDELYLQRLDESGNLIGSAVQVNQGELSNHMHHLAVLADGGVAVAWNEVDSDAPANHQTPLYLQQFDAALNAQAEPTLISSQFSPRGVDLVATASGDLKLVYDTVEGDIYDVWVHAVGTTLINRLSANGTFVGQVAAHDLEGDTLIYGFVDNAGGRFAIDPNTGIISVLDNSLLNEDVEASYTVTVKVVDERGLSVTQQYTITLQPIQDAPVITGVSAGTLVEDSANLLMTSGALVVTDRDEGESSFIPETVSGRFGEFTIEADGQWSYAADNHQVAIQNLSVGQTLKLDGTQHVTVNDDLITADNFTISLWVKPEDLSETWTPLFGSGTLGQRVSRSPSLYISNYSNPGGISWDSYDSEGVRYNTHSNNGVNIFREGEWTQITWVKDGEEYRFYANGEQFAAGDAPSEVNLNGYIQFGKGNEETLFKGELDDIQTYSRALTEDEILDVYEGHAQTDLIARFEFEGDSLQEMLTGEKDEQRQLNDLGTPAGLGERMVAHQDQSSQTLHLTSSNYLQIEESLVPSDNFTMSLWLKPDTLSDSLMGIFGSWDLVRGPSLFISNAEGKSIHWDSYDESSVRFHGSAGSNIFQTGEWTHVTWVKDGTEYRFYADGEQFATAVAPDSVKFVGFTNLGTVNINPTATTFDGELDDLQTYSRALTADEVKRVMQGEVVSELISHFDFEGEELADIYADKALYQASATETVTAESTGVRDEVLKDSVVIKTVDGTEQTLDVTIYGTNDAPEVVVTTPEDGLVAAFDFESTDDISRQGHDLTLSGGASLGEGGLILDGIDGRAELNNLHFGGAMTISVWVRYDDLSQKWMRIIDFGNGKENYNIVLGQYNNTSNLVFDVWGYGAKESHIIVSDFFEAGQWAHVTVTVDDTGLTTIYKDGEQVAERQGAVPDAMIRNNHYIGQSNWTPDDHLDGTLDDFALYDRVLSSTEVADIYANTLANKPGHEVIDPPQADESAVFQLADEADVVNAGDDLILTGSANLMPSGLLAMDGTSGAAEIEGLETGGAMTISTWVRYDSFEQSWSRIIDFGNGQAQDNILLGHQGVTNNLVFDVYIGSTKTTLVISDFFDAGQWTQVTATIDETGLVKIYKDGELAGQKQAVVPKLMVRENNYLGKSNWSNNGYLDGAIDDFAYFDRALTQEEVTAIYELPRANEGLYHIDYTLFGNAVNGGGTVSGSLALPDGYQLGETFWVSVTSGDQKAVQLQTIDNGDGTFQLKALQAKYVDSAVWDALTDIEKQSYFYSHGQTNIALVTAEGEHGYGVKDVTFNGSLAVPGIVDDVTGLRFVQQQISLAERPTGVIDAAELSLETITLTWVGASMSDHNTQTFTLPDDYQVGDEFWITKAEGHWGKGILLTTQDNGDGTIELKAIRGAADSIDIYNALTEEEKLTHFYDNGRFIGIATEKNGQAYGLRDVSFNGGVTLIGMVTTEGVTFDGEMILGQDKLENGDWVASFTANDVDNDQLHYSLIDDANGRFSIDHETGDVFVADVSRLDFETQSSHTIIAKVSDGFAETIETLQITLTDVNDAPQQVFVEKEGMLVIEMEDFHQIVDRNGPSWEMVDDITSSNRASITSANEAYHFGNSLQGSTAQYAIQVTTPGTYYLWLKSIRPEVYDNTSDSLHITLNGELQPFAMAVSGFGWRNSLFGQEERAQITIDEAGLHTLGVWVREDGYRIDQLVLTQDPDFVPEGIGHDSTPYSRSIDLGSVADDSALTVTREDLLANVIDVEGDSLSVDNVRLVSQVVESGFAFETDTSSYIGLNEALPELAALTIEMDFQATGPRLGQFDFIFSLATANHDNAISIFLENSGGIRFYINGVGSFFVGDAGGLLDGEKHRLHLTWDSTTGEIIFYVDGQVVDSSVVSTGNVIEAGGKLYLGQDQDRIDGGFQPEQALTNSQIDHVTLLSEVLTAEQIAQSVSASDVSDQVVVDLISHKGQVVDRTGNYTVTTNGTIDHYEVMSEAATLREESQLSFGADTQSRIIVNETLPELSAFTLEFFYQSTGSHSGSIENIVSLVSTSAKNLLNVFIPNTETDSVKLNFNSRLVEFSGPQMPDLQDGELYKIQLAWDAASGELRLFINGQLMDAKNSSKGSALEADGKFVIGDEQDSHGGRFDSSQATTNANIGHVSLLSEALTNEQLASGLAIVDQSDQVLFDVGSKGGQLIDRSGNFSLTVQDVAHDSYFSVIPDKTDGGDSIVLAYEVSDGEKTTEAQAQARIEARADAPSLSLVTEDRVIQETGFETPADPSRGWFPVNGDPEGWSAESGTYELQTNGYSQTPAYEGNQFLEIDYGSRLDIFSTTVDLSSGKQMALELALHSRLSRHEPIEIYWGNDLIATLTSTDEWVVHRIVLPLKDQSTEVLKFQEVAAYNNGVGPLVDVVKVLELGIKESSLNGYDYELTKTCDAAFTVVVDAMATDLDRSEYSALTLKGLPAGYKVSQDGVDTLVADVDTAVVITAGELTITPVVDANDEFVMSFTATQTEKVNGHSASTTKTLYVHDGNVAPTIGDPVPNLHFTLDGVDANTTDVTEAVKGLNGVNVGALQAGTGDSKIGSHAQFDATNKISVADTGLPATAGAVTVSFWMNWDGTLTQIPIALGGYNLLLIEDKIGFDTLKSDVWGVDFANMDLGTDASLANHWHHVTAVFYDDDIQNNALYLNGIKQDLSLVRGTSHSAANMDIHQPMTIGGYHANDSFNFTGGLDDIQVFYRAVNDQEALLLASAADASQGSSIALDQNLITGGDFSSVDPLWVLQNSVVYKNDRLQFGNSTELTDGIAEYQFASEEGIYHELSFDFARVGRFDSTVMIKVEVIDVTSGTMLVSSEHSNGVTDLETITHDFTAINDGDIMLRFSDMGIEGYDVTIDMQLDNVSVIAPSDKNLQAKPGIWVNELASGLSPDSLNDTAVFTVEAYDRDQYDILSYTLTDNAEGRFTIDNLTGVVSVSAAELLDYEAATEHQVTVEVSDGKFAVEQTYTIQVNDIDDVPVAVADSASTESGITIDSEPSLLANDSDPQVSHDELTVVSVNGEALANSGETIIAGQRGVLHIDQSGAWRYEPAAVDIESNLELYWDFNEGTGVTIDDKSQGGVKNDIGTLRNGASFIAEGFNGSAVTLDGVDDYVSVPDSSDLNLYGANREVFTLHLAFNIDADNSLAGAQVLYEQGGGSNGYNIYIHDGVLYAGAYTEVADWSGEWISTDISTLAKGQWHQVTFILDASETHMEAWLNGESFGVGSMRSVPAHGGNVGLGALDNYTKFHTGAASGNSGSFFKGAIDDVRIYERALTDSEVHALNGVFDDGYQEVFNYTLSDGDDTVSSTLTIDVANPAGLGGSDYQMVLTTDTQSVSLLEPSHQNGEVYYWLDVNQDNALTAEDRITHSELASFMAHDTTLYFDEGSLALVNEIKLAEFQASGAIPDVPAWSVDQHSGEYTLGSIDETQTQGYVIYQVIG
ncbi:MAG: VCBS domain-containing protein [Cellvibrionales bacterium]|nr:VCBS domain-containing protein [Cellvibrionales bacterium]